MISILLALSVLIGRYSCSSWLEESPYFPARKRMRNHTSVAVMASASCS